MLPKIFVLATLFAASAIAAAVPSAADNQLVPVDLYKVEDPLAACEQRGINPYGSIPSDATLLSNGIYQFEEGSDASYWARAQVAIATSPDLTKRQSGKIGIGMWTSNGCTGQGVWVDDVTTNINYYVGANMISVGISYRAMRSNEHLDFSRQNGGDWCGTYAYSAGSQTPIGCFNSQNINCYRLWV